MNKKIDVKSILGFLEENNYEYTFKGSKADLIDGYSSLFRYKENTMTFITALYLFDEYKHLFKGKEIQLIITSPSETVSKKFKNVIQIDKPQRIFFSIIEEFFEKNNKINKSYLSNAKSQSLKSLVSESATIGDNVKIGVGCVVEGNVHIGDNTVIHHNVVIRNNTKIGRNCVINSGTVIGESGFNPNTLEDGKRKMIKHYGGVTIEDDVHIGDNCSISKGTIDDTVIKKGVKLNTLIRIAHNSIIGENTVVTMPTFICGSVVIGKKCHIAATVIKNQCTIGDEATLGLGSVVVQDVPAGATVVGVPAKPIN